MTDASSFELKITPDTHTDELLAKIRERVQVPDPYLYRIHVLTPSHRTEVLEERDLVCSMLNDFGSSRVLFERYAFCKTVPNKDVAIFEEYTVAKRKIHIGEYVVGSADMYYLIVNRILAEKPDLCQLIGQHPDLSPNPTTPEQQKLIACIKDEVTAILPSREIEKQSVEAWCEGCLHLLVKETKKTKFDKGITATHFQLKYLTNVSKYPFYGCRVFRGFQVSEVSRALNEEISGELRVGMSVGVAIGWGGLRIMDDSFSEIVCVPLTHSRQKCSLSDITFEWKGRAIEDLNSSSNNKDHPDKKPMRQRLFVRLETKTAHTLVACVSWFQKHAQTE